MLKAQADLALSLNLRKRTEENITRIIIKFSIEHPEISKFITKYWPDDPILKNLVTAKTQIIFKRAGSIGNMLVQSEYKGKTRKQLLLKPQSFQSLTWCP